MTLMVLGSSAEKLLGHPLDERQLDEFRDEQLRIVWSHAAVGSIIATAFAVWLAMYMEVSAGHDLVQLWLMIKVAVSLPRIIQAKIYRRSGYPGGRSWRATTYWLLAIDGLVWGMAGAVMAGENHEVATLICACLACVAAVATFGLQSCFAATAAYVAPIVGLTALSLVARGDSFGLFGGLALSLFLALLLTTARRSERRLGELLALRLQAAQLAEQREAAYQRANEQSNIKTRFLGAISHELRTPLHGMLGVARLVRTESADAMVQRRMELLDCSGTHLLRLINDLIDVSRIEAGALRMERVAFDLDAEVRRMAEIYSARAHQKRLQFTLDNRLPSPCWVFCDPGRVQQVLHNLLGNAVKFTTSTDRPGWVGLTVELREADQVVFEVRDCGPGIPEEDLGQIFDAFRQVGQSRRLRGQGTGLGLTISRDLARALGGDITVASEVGVGSLFTFTARMQAARPEDAAGNTMPADLEHSHSPLAVNSTAQHSHEPPVAPPQDGYSEVRVVLVEDNDVNAMISMAMLAQLKLDVVRARDGREAVAAAFTPQRPHLILMDLHLPDFSGADAVRTIRARERAGGMTRLPIVALSAAGTIAEREDCIDAGMNDFLPKPLEPDVLAIAIGRWISAGGRAETLPAELPRPGAGQSRASGTPGWSSTLSTPG